MFIKHNQMAIVGVVLLALMGAVTLLTQPRYAHAQSDCAPERLQRGFENTDFCNNAIDNWSEILLGQVKDGIPAVDNPRMETIEEASAWLVDRSPVIAVEINGEARAYPHGILMRHEIANDEIGGVPVAVTFCPLCNSSIVFEREVDGEVLTFGVSGRLRNSDLVMFDRQTDSWWQQFTGEGIVGDYTGTLLDIVPSHVIGFGQFVERYPDGLVMSANGRDYSFNPYGNYDSNPRPFLFLGEDFQPRPADDRICDMEGVQSACAVERVLAGEVDGIPKAYPFGVLQNEVVVNDEIGEMPVVAFWQPGVNTALGDSDINEARDIGTAALYSRELEDGTLLTFTWDADNQVLTDEQTGSTWNLFGEATAGDLEGETLRQLIAAPHFWFAWAAFHPETEVYGLES